MSDRRSFVGHSLALVGLGLARDVREPLGTLAALLRPDAAADAAAATAPPARPFALDRVTLLDGPFRDAQQRALRGLAAHYDVDRLLAGFRREAGLPAVAEPYGGWEGRGIAGHSLGHYLSARALAWAVTGERAHRAAVRQVVAGLAAVQAAHGNGYLGAFPDGRRVFEQEIARGDVRSQGFDLNGLWVPLYTHHKVLAGLRDAHRLAGDREALAVAHRFAGWLHAVLMPLDDATMRRVMACEYGGLPEVLADLWASTGDRRCLALARRFDADPVRAPLLEGRDALRGLHANTQIPKLVAAARLHDLTGDAASRRAAEVFWERVVRHHSYVTGSNSLAEHFGPPDVLGARLGSATAETCNVYNMLKLSALRFAWAPSADVAEYMERALLNHSLASQHPGTGHTLYFLPLAMGARKAFDDPHAFTCCVGSGMEHHLLYGGWLYFHDDDGLYVNQFVASELRWPERGVTLRQHTRFPDEQATTLTWTVRRPTTVELRVRRPRWAAGDVQVTVNGAPVEARALASGHLAVRRTWRTGDAVRVAFPFALRLERTPDQPDRAALLHGPLVLAGDLGAAVTPGERVGADADAGLRGGALDDGDVPVLIPGERALAEWVTPVAGAPNTFRTRGVGAPHDVTLRPLFRIADERYAVYWDLFTPDGWRQRRAEREAERRAAALLARRTTDVLQPGAMQPERDHDFQGERSEAGTVYERQFRHAFPGGWFAYTLVVDPAAPMELVATYWGDESDERVFDVLVEGERVATQRLLHDVGARFFTVRYALPERLTRGRRRVTVRFAPHPGRMAGGVFGLRAARVEGTAGVEGSGPAAP